SMTSCAPRRLAGSGTGVSPVTLMGGPSGLLGAPTSLGGPRGSRFFGVGRPLGRFGFAARRLLTRRVLARGVPVPGLVVAPVRGLVALARGGRTGRGGRPQLVDLLQAFVDA